MVDIINSVFNIILTVVNSGNPVFLVPFFFTAALGLVYIFFRIFRRV